MVGRQLLARGVTACGLGLSLLAGCAGCGGGSSRVVVAVGHETITSATVARWMSALAPEHRVPDSPSFDRCVARAESISPGSDRSVLAGECQQEYETLKQHALGLLISSRWLIGEAREQGLPIAAGEVDRRLTGGHALPIVGGQITAADRRLAAEAAVASARIRQRLMEREGKLTEARIEAYYRAHITGYSHPEIRQIYLSEGVRSLAKAIQLRKELIAGKADIHKNSEPETIDRSHPPSGLPGEAQILHTIYTAKLNVFTQPQPFNHHWAFVKVIQITPGSVEPLAKVRGAIEAHLHEERLRRALATFIPAWRAKWQPRTDCRPGYVVQSCRQFTGQPAAEQALPFS